MGSQRVVLVGIVGMVGLQAKQLIDSKSLGSMPGDFHKAIVAQSAPPHPRGL